MSKTNYMMIEQTALKPWREDVDIVDAALVNHVHVRLSRWAKQRIVVHEGVQCVWIHYPTVRGENWLLQLKDRTLSARFTKLVNLGLLIRRQISLKSGKGSRTYYGISDVLKKQYEELDDRVDRDHADLINIEGTHPQQNAGHSYEAQNDAGAYDAQQTAGHSLSRSKVNKITARAGAPLADGANSPPPRRSVETGIKVKQHNEAIKSGDTERVRLLEAQACKATVPEDGETQCEDNEEARKVRAIILSDEEPAEVAV